MTHEEAVDLLMKAAPSDVYFSIEYGNPDERGSWSVHVAGYGNLQGPELAPLVTEMVAKLEAQ